MTLMPTWKSYLNLALVFFGCWPLLFLPVFESLFTAYPLMSLIFLVPFVASFVCGLKYGYKMLTGSALISATSLSAITLISIEDLMHDDTLMGGLRYAAGIGLRMVCVVLMLIVAGAFTAKHGLAARSIGVIAGAVSLSVFLFLGTDGPPVSYGLNYHTLQVLAAALAAIVVLALVALFTNRTTERIKGSV